MSAPSSSFLQATPRTFGLVGLAYVLAVAAAWATMRFAPPMHPLLALFLADVVATIVIFGFSRAFDNSSFYDPYWSVMPIVLAAYLPFSGLPGVVPLNARQVLMVAVVGLWAVRLTVNWMRGWTGLSHEDWRYVEFRKQFPRAYWAVSFGGVHFFPTVCTFLGSLAMWPVATSSTPLGVLDFVGAGIAIGGTVIEYVADEQMRAFRLAQLSGGSQSRTCEVGLWAWSRHPNYFGEISFWVGVWVVGITASRADAWWTASGPLLMIVLFVFASIPMMEKRSVARRPEYADVQKRISMLVPWPPRRAEKSSPA
jgi:steroid 5-alpha reductase family enzyme